MNRDELIRRVAEAALSPEERLDFLGMCEARSAEDLVADRRRVAGHLRAMERGADEGATFDLGRARLIAATLDALLKGAPSVSFEQRRLLAGAVEYFVTTDDLIDDYGNAHGLDDDARVVAAVCHALDRPDLALRLEDPSAARDAS
jgi:uncharacterized membrane protein YkvA (DUF1232 family)